MRGFTENPRGSQPRAGNRLSNLKAGGLRAGIGGSGGDRDGWKEDKKSKLGGGAVWGWTLGLGWGRKPGEGDARGAGL